MTLRSRLIGPAVLLAVLCSIAATSAAQVPAETGPQVSITTSEQRALVVAEVVPPKVLREVTPPYPELARSAGVQGTVSINLTIAADGAIKRAAIGSAVTTLADSTLEAIRLWRFEPARFNGLPVEVTFTKAVDFSKDRPVPTITDSPARIHIDAGNEPPKLTKRIEPVLPKDAPVVGALERLIVEVIVDASGKVKATKVLRHVNDGLERATMEALRQWVYEPAKVNGAPAEIAFTTVVEFRRR